MKRTVISAAATLLALLASCSSSSPAAPSCSSGAVTCAGACTNVQTDNANCGACGTKCGAGEACVAGKCAASCGTGASLCSPDGGAAYCANFQSDDANCGACGTKCGSGEACVNGQCGSTCGQNGTLCTPATGAAYCANVQTDNANCGVCGAGCPAGEACVAGACSVTCPGTQINCAGSCVAPATDPNHCGASGDCGATTGSAGTACSAGQACVQGSCSASCGGTLVACGGSCIDPATSGTYCGASGDCGVTGGSAGTACAAGQQCVTGICSYYTAYPSFLSPGGLQATTSHPVDLDFTIGTPGGATVYYTVDGTAPVPNTGTTQAGASPLVLHSVPGADGGTTLTWYADYGSPVGPELSTHRTVITTSGPSNNLGSYVDDVKFAGPGGPVIVVAPGAAVTGTVNYMAWRSNGSGYCPGCVVQWVLGVDGVGQLACIDPVTSTWPGSGGTQNFSFTAPSKPGVYYLRQGLSLQYTCQGAGYPGGEEVGEVIVAN